MKWLTILGAALTLVACVGPKPSPRSDRFPLAVYVGRNLRELPEKELKSLDEWLESKIPGLRTGRLADGEPWAIWDWDKNGSRFAVVLGAPETMTPGESRAAICVFDRSGQLLGGSVFQAGTRTVLESCELYTDPDLGRLVRFHIRAGLRSDLKADHFDVALDGSRPALVRLASPKGELVQNEYQSPNLAVGPSAPVDQLEQHLKNGSAVQVIEALNWLGGSHSEPTYEISDGSGERMDDSIKYAELIADPELARLVKSRVRSGSAPVVLAAKAVERNLKPPRRPEQADPVSDLLVETVRKGSGDSPTDGFETAAFGDEVTVRYSLARLDGYQLATDSRVPLAKTSFWETGPYDIDLGEGSMFPGFEQAIAGMRVGEVREAWIPWRLAFGALELPNLPPFSDLKLTVELLAARPARYGAGDYRDEIVGSGAEAEAGLVAEIAFEERDGRGRLLHGANRETPLRVLIDSENRFSLSGMKIGGKRVIFHRPDRLGSYSPFSERLRLTTVELLGVRESEPSL